jgi:hypothetical protein
LGVNARSSAAAEKGGEGLALKIFTGAKSFLKVHIKPFGITEMEMLPSMGTSPFYIKRKLCYKIIYSFWTFWMDGG